MSLPCTPRSSRHRRVTRPQPQPKSSSASSFEEPLEIRRARDADAQVGGRDRQPVVGNRAAAVARRERVCAFVGAEGDAQQPETLQQAKEARLHAAQR
jgi:hypothetical protein